VEDLAMLATRQQVIVPLTQDDVLVVARIQLLPDEREGVRIDEVLDAAHAAPRTGEDA
jgi:hypothetical protein